jgi:hypothetical protein
MFDTWIDKVLWVFLILLIGGMLIILFVGIPLNSYATEQCNQKGYMQGMWTSGGIYCHKTGQFGEDIVEKL